MNESDWKVFKKIKTSAIDKFCTNVFKEFSDVINNEDVAVHDRYLQLYKMVQDKDKKMEILFNGHSRSGAPMQLFSIRKAGLADQQYLLKLSDEFLKQTDPETYK